MLGIEGKSRWLRKSQVGEVNIRSERLKRNEKRGLNYEYGKSYY